MSGSLPIGPGVYEVRSRPPWSLPHPAVRPVPGRRKAADKQDTPRVRVFQKTFESFSIHLPLFLLEGLLREVGDPGVQIQSTTLSPADKQV